MRLRLKTAHAAKVASNGIKLKLNAREFRAYFEFKKSAVGHEDFLMIY